MTTIPSNHAVAAFDSRATNFYLTNTSENRTTAFSTKGGVTLSISNETLSANSGHNDGKLVFEMDITNKWITASFDPIRGIVAVLAIGNGMVETRSKVSNDGVYGTTTNVLNFTCNLAESGTLSIIVSGNKVQMTVKKQLA